MKAEKQFVGYFSPDVNMSGDFVTGDSISLTQGKVTLLRH